METLYGLMAEFDTPEAILSAARKAYAQGYRRMDAYTPFPIEELSEAIGFHHPSVPLLVLLGGIVGGLGGYFLQVWAMAWNYPLNIGGGPAVSLPAGVSARLVV